MAKKAKAPKHAHNSAGFGKGSLLILAILILAVIVMANAT